MRILHTADWHLGRVLHEHSLLDDQAHALDQIVAAAGRERPDVVIVAGDVYDRSVPPTEAVDLLNRTLNRIVGELRIPTVVLAGNHDSGTRLDFGAALLRGAGLHLCGRPEPETRPLEIACADGGTLHVCPMPFSEPARVRELDPEAEVRSHDGAHAWWAARYAKLLPEGAVAVAVAHTFVTGGVISDSERSLTVGGTEQVSAAHFDPFAYTALGHLHRPQHCGSERVRYSGSLLKYSLSEAQHDKGFTLVDIAPDGSRVEIRHVDIRPRRDVRVVTGTWSEVLAAAKGGNGSREDYVFVQLAEDAMPVEPERQLRAHYPNILNVALVRRAPGGAAPQAARDLSGLNDLDLFRTFYQHVQGEPLQPGSEQEKALIEVLESMNSEEQA